MRQWDCFLFSKLDFLTLQLWCFKWSGCVTLTSAADLLFSRIKWPFTLTVVQIVLKPHEWSSLFLDEKCTGLREESEIKDRQSLHLSYWCAYIKRPTNPIIISSLRNPQISLILWWQDDGVTRLQKESVCLHGMEVQLMKLLGTKSCELWGESMFEALEVSKHIVVLPASPDLEPCWEKTNCQRRSNNKP